MTDNKRLALAKAVFPERDVAENGLDGRTWITTIDGAPSPWVPFDPANNGDQAIAVLAWLLRNFRCDLSHNAVTVWHSNDILICDIDYDGTAAGLRKAVTEAGMRVV